MVVLMGLALGLSKGTFAETFAETGPFEITSLLLWLIACIAVFALLRPRISIWLAISMSIVILIAAGREADLHKAFTGYSVLKLGYYFDGSFPLTQRLIFSGIMLIFIAALARITVAIIECLRTRRGPLRGWESLVLIALTLVVLTKLTDRAPNMIEDLFSVTVGEGVRRYTKAFEEGMETLVPLLLIMAMALFLRSAVQRLPQRGDHAQHPPATA